VNREVAGRQREIREPIAFFRHPRSNLISNWSEFETKKTRARESLKLSSSPHLLGSMNQSPREEDEGKDVAFAISRGSFHKLNLRAHRPLQSSKGFQPRIVLVHRDEARKERVGDELLDVKDRESRRRPLRVGSLSSSPFGEPEGEERRGRVRSLQFEIQ